MNDREIRDILNAEKAWLAKRPGMTPWRRGCQRLLAMLDECLRRYSEQVREPAADAADTDRPLYLARLWRCLSHHWRDGAASDAQCVANRIASGRGYRGGEQLGGDPLRDVVLAVAMVRGDSRATQVFQDDYFVFARRLAGKQDRRLAEEPELWWNDLLDHLAGYSRPSAKLDTFGGRCALQNWLPPVVWNFLRRWRRPVADGPVLDDPPDRPPAPDESLDHFARIVRAAVADLSPRDRLLLALVYVDGLKQNEAAGVLGVHPAQVTRGLDKALPRLEAAIRQHAADRLSPAACEGVFEDLRENPPLFALRLREALEEGRQAFQPDPAPNGQAGKPDVPEGRP